MSYIYLLDKNNMERLTPQPTGLGGLIDRFVDRFEDEILPIYFFAFIYIKCIFLFR